MKSSNESPVESQSEVNLPYKGIRILDLSQGIAGPSCAGILARQGAEVIKVEPFAGDWARLMGGGEDGITALSISSNVGKKSICIDATTKAGSELILRLASEVDVLIESFRPGVMDKLGLGYQTVSKINPRVLYLSVSGFGSTGPCKDLPGADSVLQAMSGMMVMNRDGEGAPRRVGMLLVDAASGIYAANSIATALFARANTGRGRKIDITLLAVTAALQSIPIIDDYMHPGGRPPVTVPSGTFRTADGLINLTALRDKMFFGVGRAIGHPDWEHEPAYKTNQLRLSRAAEINRLIQKALIQNSTDYWVERFRSEDVLCAPVLDYSGFRTHPQVEHERVFTELNQPGFGIVPIPGVPGLDPAAPVGSAPFKGEHSAEVLQAFGLDDADISRLESAKVIYVRRSSADDITSTGVAK